MLHSFLVYNLWFKFFISGQQIQLPFDKFLGSHLRFGFRHLSKIEGKMLFDFFYNMLTHAFETSL